MINSRGHAALPHDVALAGFVREISDLYGLQGEESLELAEDLRTAVNTAAINALAARPRVPEPVEVKPQGVQDGPEFMRPAEVSAALGIPLSTLANMRTGGTGPAFSKQGKSVFYRREDVRKWTPGPLVPVLGTVPSTPVRDSLGPIPTPESVEEDLAKFRARMDDPSELRS